MKYLYISILLILAYTIGQLTVEKFYSADPTAKQPKPAHHWPGKTKVVVKQDPAPTRIIENKIIIEDPSANDAPYQRSTNSSVQNKDGEPGPSEIVIGKGENITSEGTSFTPDSNESQISEKLAFGKSNSAVIQFLKQKKIEFISIGKQIFKEGDKEYPAIYAFFNLNFNEKPIAVQWFVEYESKIYTKIIWYSSTKVGLNRAIVFTDKTFLPGAPKDNVEFLKELKVQLIFYMDGKLIGFKEAQIGEIDLLGERADTSDKILKSRQNTGLNLSDNYNPILREK